MTPRALDVLVAEHVFQKGPLTHVADWLHGSEPDEGGTCRGWWCRICSGERMPAMISFAKRDGEVHYNYSLPTYSSDIQNAWLVTDAMRARGWQFSLHTFDDDYPLIVRFVQEDSACSACGSHKYKQGEYEGPLDVPRAIAICALKALGVEVPA